MGGVVHSLLMGGITYNPSFFLSNTWFRYTCMSNTSGNVELGVLPNLYAVGMVCFGSLILVANCKILIISKNYSVLSILFLVFSILSYPLIYWAWNSSDLVDAHGTYDAVSGNSQTYVVLFAILALVWTTDKAIIKYYCIFTLTLVIFNLEFMYNWEM